MTDNYQYQTVPLPPLNVPGADFQNAGQFSNTPAPSGNAAQTYLPPINNGGTAGGG